MAGSFAVEQDDAPVAVEGVEAVADPVENRGQSRFGAKRSDLFGNESLQLGGQQVRATG
jgi:hypothetical protein